MNTDGPTEAGGNFREAQESLERLREAAEKSELGTLDTHRALRGPRFSKPARETYWYLATKAVDPCRAASPGVAELNHAELKQHLRKHLQGNVPKAEWLEHILANLEDCCLIERPPEAERKKGKSAQVGYEVRVLTIDEMILSRAKKHARWLLDMLPEEEAMQVVESWLTQFWLHVTCDEVDAPFGLP